MISEARMNMRSGRPTLQVQAVTLTIYSNHDSRPLGNEEWNRPAEQTESKIASTLGDPVPSVLMSQSGMSKLSLLD